MAELLRCADRWGREVVLYEDTWYDKILVDHPIMDGQLDAVEQSLSNPDRVNYDAKYGSGENYYLYDVLQYPIEGFYLKVVVRFETHEGVSMGTVISAYPTRGYGRAGERMKWHARGRR